MAAQMAAAEYVDRSYRVFCQPAARAVPGDGVRGAAGGAAARRSPGCGAAAERHGPAVTFPVEVRVRGGRRRPALHGVGPRLRLPRRARAPRAAARGLLRRRRVGDDRRSAGARTGASCTPAPPRTLRARLPGVRRVRRPARPARPGGPVPQRLPGPGAGGASHVRVADLTTPALLVDADALDANLADMAAALPGPKLRPHVKAHKTTALAARQAAAGHTGLHLRDGARGRGHGEGRAGRGPAARQRGARHPAARARSSRAAPG